MADNPDGKSGSEPTMEEILASIRKIIADEKEPEPEAVAPPAEEVIELTQMVQDDGSVVDLAAQPAEAAPPAPPPPPPPPPPHPPQAPPAASDLISEKTAMSAADSLTALANTVQIERMAASVPTSATLIANGARTMEDMISELIKPMLRDWLDQNLTSIVEKLVQKEIERIAHRVQD